MTKKNLWTIFKYEVLADFAIDFNSEISIDKIFEIVEKILDLSRDFEVCVIDVDGKTNQYMDYLKFTWDSFDFVYPYYLPGYKFYSGELRYPFTKISMYEESEVVSRYVSEMCNINYTASYIKYKKELGRWPFEYHNYFSACSEMVPPAARSRMEPPITLSMGNFSKHSGTIASWSLTGSVRSDIWLDKVSSLKPYESCSYVPAIEESDNRELASHNAPRLKGFLQGLKSVADQHEGEWFFESENEAAYELMR